MKMDKTTELYTRMIKAAGTGLSEMEELLSMMSETAAGESDFRDMLLRLEQTGSAFRKEATGFLTSDDAADTDEGTLYDAKRHVHTDLGSVLTLSREYLKNSDVSVNEKPAKEREELIMEWREVLTSLRSGKWKKKITDAKKQITEAAAAAGVKTVFVSAIPDEEDALRAFIRESVSKIIACARSGGNEVEI